MSSTKKVAASPSSSPLKPQGLLSSSAAAVLVGLCALCLSSVESFPSLTGPPAPTKPYRTFLTFFPFYLSEHSHSTNRALHCIGTGILLLLSLFNPHVLLSQLLALCVGICLCSALQGIEHGLIEFGCVLILYAVFLRLLNGYWLDYGLLLPVIGYTFAWLGHFKFEHNQPATFIYPSFSLMGDYYMFFRVCLGLEKI